MQSSQKQNQKTTSEKISDIILFVGLLCAVFAATPLTNHSRILLAISIVALLWYLVFGNTDAIIRIERTTTTYRTTPDKHGSHENFEDIDRNDWNTDEAFKYEKF